MSKIMCTFVKPKIGYYNCKNMINRINLILRAKNITAKQFAEEIGIQPSGMSHILSGRNNPSLEFVSKVIRRYPEIDANWLLLGKGEMYGQLGSRNQESGMREEESLPEPTLFSAPLPAPAPLSEPEEAVEEQEIREECDLQDLPDCVSEECGQEKKEPAPIKQDGRRMVKILMFYDDHTFEEYRPL